MMIAMKGCSAAQAHQVLRKEVCNVVQGGALDDCNRRSAQEIAPRYNGTILTIKANMLQDRRAKRLQRRSAT